MATTADIKNGKCIVMNHDIWQIVEFQHVKPGKGAAFVRTKIKSLNNGKVLDHTFPAGHKLEFARVERRKYQYLYKDDMGFNFMNNETYDQIALEEFKINAPEFLKEGANVEILFHAEVEKVLACYLPQFVVLNITQSDPGIKGDTASNTFKPATLETGATIQVPLFVNEGEDIKIDTVSKAYVERVKA